MGINEGGINEGGMPWGVCAEKKNPLLPGTPFLRLWKVQPQESAMGLEDDIDTVF